MGVKCPAWQCLRPTRTCGYISRTWHPPHTRWLLDGPADASQVSRIEFDRGGTHMLSFFSPCVGAPSSPCDNEDNENCENGCAMGERGG